MFSQKEYLIELEEWKLNKQKDEAHQIKINKLINDYKQKQLVYKRECVIKNEIINNKYNYSSDYFID